jgi:hypothetical protein
MEANSSESEETAVGGRLELGGDRIDLAAGSGGQLHSNDTVRSSRTPMAEHLLQPTSPQLELCRWSIS